MPIGAPQPGGPSPHYDVEHSDALLAIGVEPPCDADALTRSRLWKVRVVMPWRAWWMRVRRWERPAKT